ncbi:transposase family protein [Streptomyces virginiae]|uniref:transposase family protein n=1 Tax=Streptomyces virginiae TaxID=1961 RepID=UPI00345613D8
MEDVALQLKALLFPAIADIAVRSVDVDVEKVRLDAQCTTAGAACPGCGVCSTRVHSSYLRFLADVPSAGRSVVLQVRVRRFRCGNTKCPRRTFVEQISGLTRRHGQRTERLRSILTAVGLALAGRAGARHRQCLRVLVLDREGKAEPPALPEEKTDSPWRSERFANRVRARHATVHALLEAGHSRRSIGRQLQMTHRTVKSLADAAKPEDLFRGQWQHNRTSILDEYKPYLDERWDEGCTNAWKLWEEIVPLGYRGSYGRVSAYLREKRTSPRPVTAQPPAPRAVTRWILSRPETLTEIEQLRLKAVLANCPELDALTGHVRSFAHMLTERQGERLPQWLDAVRQDDLPSLHTLAAGIDRDCDAVIAGLTLPWNSGVVEGHVNRIKMLKRQMFGRAGFDLLRKRVLPA